MIHRGNEGRYDKVGEADTGESAAKWKAMMRDGSQRLAIALGVNWPCEHKRVPENTLRIGEREQCRTCRRRRWMRGFKAVCVRRAENIARLKKAHKMRGVILACDKRLVHHALHDPGEGRLPVKALVQKVSASMGMEPDRLMKAKRATSDIRDGRAVVFRILRDRGLSYPVIGEAMGGKDHSTIIHALKQFNAYLAGSEKMAIAYGELRDKPNG